MYGACIAIADASRARLFVYQRSAEAEGVREQLVEHLDLVNPARRKRPFELYSDAAGKNRTRRLHYGLDDHRAAHLDQLDAEFARIVIHELERLLRMNQVQRVILCAGPGMLGALRGAAGALEHSRLVIDELPRNLVKLATPAIRDQLARYGMLPQRPPRPAFARMS